MKNLKYAISGCLPRELTLIVKYIYHALYRIINNKPIIGTNLQIKRISCKNCNVFFGYYDISPFNEETDEFIYLKQKKNSSYVEVLISRLPEFGTKEEIIAQTKAWNWQQGCRLRWMPHNSREVVFNDYQNGSYLARILDVDTRSERIVKAPLYDISPDGKYGLSLNFERLGIMRPGYGYTCKQYTANENELYSEGIDLVDIEDNHIERIVSYKDMIQTLGVLDSSFAKSYINHISFSPSGKLFLFFWITIIGERHKASLIVFDLEKRKLIPLETDLSVSHYVWADDDNIICTAYDDEHNCAYYNYNIKLKTKKHLDYLPSQDGHPSILGVDEIITDTYPDLKGFQHLYKCGTDTKASELMTIYSTCMREGEQRTDLHPRISKKGGIVCFDANVKKYRELFLIYLQ